MQTQRQQLLYAKEVFISCIVPVHNEDSVIASFLGALNEKLYGLANRYEIIVIDDGSTDQSLVTIERLLPTYPIKLLKLSRNFGKETALTAGLDHASGDVVILIDADFQHPIGCIDDFLQHWALGYEMVYGIRGNRNTESTIKRYFAHLFYQLLSRITQIHIPSNAGDFRLLDRKVVDTLSTFEERTRFMKGLYAWVGYRSIGIPFVVQERQSGKTSWQFWRLTELAITGITSFSDIPLRVWSFIGFIISIISFNYALYIILDTMINGKSIPGFASIFVSIMFFGGIQLLSIGILGEYIARIFNEVKKRPKYIIEKKTGFDTEIG
jgi:glycosyltransferase involved in cell wall biosynthesis